MIKLLFILLLYSSRSWYIFAENNNSRFGKNGQELLLCRKCGADVADSYYLFSKESPGAQKIKKQNLFGRQNVTVQTLVNPFGIKFEIVTAEKARCESIGTTYLIYTENCITIMVKQLWMSLVTKCQENIYIRDFDGDMSQSQGADSWFPGYTWRICTCPHCGQHLGWTFESSKLTDSDTAGDTKLFHGLILSNVLGENFTDSLIMMPKMYKM